MLKKNKHRYRKVVIIIAKNGKEPQKEKDTTRINGEIRAKECRLIDETGEQMGVVSVAYALETAEERGYDLVEIAPGSDPVVCRIMDYGKFKYEKQKKEKENKKNSKQQQLKEMKFRCGIGDGDYQTKKKHIARFLEQGSKVKITIMFRGREMSHADIGVELLDRLTRDLEGVADVVSAPNLEGRNMSMVIVPSK